MANLSRYFGGDDHGAVDVDTYAGLLRQAYQAIKRANPRVVVISGAPAATGYFGAQCTRSGCDNDVFLERLYAVGAGRYIDCVGVAVLTAVNAPEVRQGGPTGDHPMWYYLGTLDVSYDAFRGTKPICLTSLGYMTNDGLGLPMPPGTEWSEGATLQKQASWLAAAIARARRDRRVRMAIVNNWDGPSSAGTAPGKDIVDRAFFAILRPDGSCPACVPIANAIRSR